MSEQNELEVQNVEEQAPSTQSTTSQKPSPNGAAPDSQQHTEISAAQDDGESQSDPVVLQAELEAAQSRADEYYNQLQRVTADFQNARRRQEKQLSDSIERASQRTVVKLLPILDDLDLAFQNVPDDLTEQQTQWLNGFSQIQQKLRSLLADEGVQAIEPTGQFNPERHDAISSEPTDEVESGHIIATLRTGYEQKGRVLRPAMVRVAA